MAFIETFEMLLHLIWKILYFFLPIPSQYESLGVEHRRGVSRDRTPGLSVSYQPQAPLNIARTRSSTPRPVRVRRTCRRATVQVIPDRDFPSERGSSICLSPRRWSPSPTPNINPEDPYFYVSYDTDSDSDTELRDEQEVASDLLGITTRAAVPLPGNQEEMDDRALLVAENQKNSAYLRNGDGIITFSIGLGRKLLDSLGLPSRRLVSLPHFKNLTSEGWTLGKRPDADTTLNEETQPFTMRLKLAGTWDAAENNKVAIGFRTFLVDTLLPQMATHAEVDLTINEVDGFRFDPCRLHPWNQTAQLAESHTDSFVLDGPAPYFHEILTFAPQIWTQNITNLKLLHHSIPVSTLRAVLTSFPALDDLIVDRIAENSEIDLDSPREGKTLLSPKKMFIASEVVLWSFLSVLEIQPHSHGRDIHLDLSRVQNMGDVGDLTEATQQLAGLEIMLPPNVLPRHFSRQLAMVGWGATSSIDEGPGGQGYITLGTKRLI